jgi:thioredoxin-related protein
MDRTLLLVVRKGCRFCDESMPFYKRLGDDPTLAKRTQFVLVAPDGEIVSREELAKQQVRVDQVVTKSLAALKVQGTPTAILVGKTGRIEKVMVGRLDEKQQEELVLALKAPMLP